MADLHTHRLDGCAPTPLASYLKALGVLRLVSSAANNVRAEAADASARGWWAGERFHLKTWLDRDALTRFFLEDYAPSPIIAPWNGGSGFYYREGKTGEKDPATGKMIKTGVRNAPTEATRRVDTIASSSSGRLRALARAVQVAREVIREFGLSEAPDPKSGKKAAFIDRYRSLSTEDAADWVDAALVVTGTQFDPAALLGSGGNDGNLDFSTAFQSALLSVIDPRAGIPSAEASIVLDGALFDRSVTGTSSAGISQMAPGTIVAANSGNGFWGTESGNPWSLLLMFEGAVAFCGVATRRGAANRARGSFPFTVSQFASGSGAVGVDDESSSRSAELWLPLWERPASFIEIRALLGEGRAHLGGEEARDGLTFARAVSALGVSRGIDEFVRLGFEARYGNMFITVPLGRFPVPKRRRVDLIADLTAGDWLFRARRLAREKSAPARARGVVRRLEDALFDMTRADRQRDGLQAGLMALGGVVSWLATSREGREKVDPPPRLTRTWVRAADDGTSEFRIAAALASLGHDQQERQSAEETQEAPRDSSEAGGESAARTSPPPMAAHFAPVEERTVDRRRRRWAENDPPGVVWGAGGLVQNMTAVLERRLVEQAARGLDEKPLVGASSARLADIAAFLEGPPAFDDTRCAALLSGLVWAQQVRLGEGAGVAPVPFAYAALKPLFTPDSHLKALRVLPEIGKLPIPPGLIGRLRRGAVDDAVRDALNRARASGIASTFNPVRNSAGPTRFGAGVDPTRLAAALLIPINQRALQHLLGRAYSHDEKEEADDAA